jgi:hypothetical protein
MSGLALKILSQTPETVAAYQTTGLTQKTSIILGHVGCDKKVIEAVMEMPT